MTEIINIFWSYNTIYTCFIEAKVGVLFHSDICTYIYVIMERHVQLDIELINDYET